MERRRDRREDWLGEGLLAHTPEPPFTTVADSISYLSCRLDADAVRPYIPRQLQLADPCDGQLVYYQSGLSWGLGAFTRTVFGVEVEGLDSPDGSKAIFLIVDLVSPRVIPVFERFYGKVDACETHVRRHGNSIDITAGPDGMGWIDLSMRVTGPLTPNNSGIDRYIGMTDDGLVQHDAAYAATAQECAVESFVISPSAPLHVQACRPVSIHFTGVNPSFAGTMSIPLPITSRGDDLSLRSFLDVMQAEGRATAVVSKAGHLLRANNKALRLLSQVPPSEVAAAVATESSGGRSTRLQRKSGPPLIVRTTPFRLPGTIEDLVLVLLIDLADSEPRSARPFLQLLGLTTAEATIAEFVGSGLSAIDAATALRLSIIP